MRRWLGLLPLFFIAVLVLLPTATAGVLVPGTEVQVISLDARPKVVPGGSIANFSWALFNAANSSHVVQVTARAEDPDFLPEVVPATVDLQPGELVEVYVTVTAPRTAETRTTRVLVLFEVVDPASSLEVDATITSRPIPTALGVITAFAAVGGIIAIGFLATLIFERTKVPDLLILILLGLVLGPVALTYLGISLLPPGVLETATPYFSALALMIILFDGGLNLRFHDLFRNLPVAGLHTLLTFTITVAAVGAVTHMVLGYDLVVGLLLGSILGGTSGAVVIGIVRRLEVTGETKLILTVESVLTDVLCVITAISIIELLRSGPGSSPFIVLSGLFRAFFVALLFGFAVGMGWLILFRKVGRKPFSYMMTVAVLFAVYALAEVSGGSGAMASFVFGLVLGNHAELARYLNLPANFIIDARIKQFHSELTFVVRAFFFVFLGLVFTFQISGGWRVQTDLPVLRDFNGTFVLFLAGVLFIFLVIVGIRLVAANLVSYLRDKSRHDRRILWVMMGRGLAAAVLASLPFTLPAFTSPSTPADQAYQALMAPYQSQFLNVAFFIILLTVGVTTAGVAMAERAAAIGREEPAGAPEAPTQGLLAEVPLWDIGLAEERPREKA
jgi:cell volume regulation protein A